MPVYVDPIRRHMTKLPWKRWSHMYADTLDELHTMAARLGLKREWFQDHPRLPHYDVIPTKRALAVKLGAIEVSGRELVAFVRRHEAAAR